MPYRYYTRRFLNKRGFHAGAYVLALVEDTSKRQDDRVWTDVELTISDCGRQISLSFDVQPSDLANSLYKLDVLLSTLSRFRAALVEEGRLAAEREASAKAKTTTAKTTTAKTTTAKTTTQA
jgi:hypothetical protein